MQDQSEEQARALEPTLGDAASPASRHAMVQLAALPRAAQVLRLFHYAKWDLGNLVRCALAAGASVHSCVMPTDTPVLCLAAQEGSARALSALLTGGADVRLADKQGYTALHWAAHQGHAPCVSLLLAAGAPLEVKGGGVGRTPLAAAAYNGHSDALGVLLEHGASANVVELMGNTPLIEATARKHARCVELLLPNSDLSFTSKQGQTAFHVSVRSASYDCFKLLLPHYSDVDVRTVPGVNLRSCESQPTFGNTALHLACQVGQDKMLGKLLRSGASRTARDSWQATPLHYAAMFGHLSLIVQLIGRAGAYRISPADVSAADKFARTPLHLAALNGHDKICRLLVAAGAQLDARDNNGCTPHMLAERQHPTNKSLLDLLAGRGPVQSGISCDLCGRQDEPSCRLTQCSGCQLACYCSAACQLAAWEAHEPECGRLKAEREELAQVDVLNSVE